LKQASGGRAAPNPHLENQQSRVVALNRQDADESQPGGATTAPAHGAKKYALPNEVYLTLAVVPSASANLASGPSTKSRVSGQAASPNTSTSTVAAGE